MIRLTWELCEGWIAGYIFAGPRRDPVKQAEVDFIMAVWRLTETMRRVGSTAEEAAEAMRHLIEAMPDEPTVACQA